MVQPMKSIFFILFLILVQSMLAQTGKLVIRISPPQAIVRVDSIPYKVWGATMELSAGGHRIQSWAPTYEYLDTIVQVREDSTTTFSKLLRYSPEYQKYLY